MTQDRDTHGRSDHHDTGTLDRARDKAASVLGTSREAADDAARRAVESIEANPLGILVGGLALGVVAGALIPRSDKEKELLAPVGKQLGDRAKIAIEAAKNAGKAELDELGLSKSAARDQAKSLFQGVAKALSTAGSAAAHSAATKKD